MATEASVILLEFNELCPSLMEQFMAAGELPAFKRLFNESLVYVTEAAEKSPNLDPWIQWVTVHTGLNYSDHGIQQLDEGHRLKKDRLWDIVSAAGKPVWVCGSMSVDYKKPISGCVIPDPWATHVAPHPQELATFFNFVQRNVLEYTNEKMPLTMSDYAAFLYFLLTHGLTVSTGIAVIEQLISERRNGDRWKRATLLDKMQTDVFAHVYKKLKPAFSTFFLNSTAHFQHFYWRNMEPDKFQVQPSAADNAKYGGAILYGYREMDKIVGRFIDLAGSNATLILSTAISQQACTVYEEDGGRLLYRPREFEQVLRLAGVKEPYTVAPVMAHQFHVFFQTEEQAKEAEPQMCSLRLDGKQVLEVTRKGNQIYSGSQIYFDVPKDAKLETSGAPQAVLFDEVFYRIEGMKSGMHHADGIFWVRNPKREHKVNAEKVALDSVAPTILDILKLAQPSQMGGTSLLKPQVADKQAIPV